MTAIRLPQHTLRPLPADDLAYVAEKGDRAWHQLRGATVLVTGASGFVGSWIAETAGHLPALATEGIRVIAHVRREDAAVPITAAEVLVSDITDLVVPRTVTHIVHCASAGDGRENVEETDRVCETIYFGTQRMVKEADRVGAKLLVVSSGSVYDAHAERTGWAIPDDAPRLTRHDGTPAHRFAWSKRNAEDYCITFNPRGGWVIARLFACFGPRMPEHLLIGQMMHYALTAAPGASFPTIRDGDHVRPNLYAADMARYLWHLLAFGDNAAYNVSAAHVMTLGALAGDFAGLGSRTGFGCRTNATQPVSAFMGSREKLTRLAGALWCDEPPFAAMLRRWYAWEVAGR